MMKKILSLLMCTALFLGALPMSAHANEANTTEDVPTIYTEDLDPNHEIVKSINAAKDNTSGETLIIEQPNNVEIQPRGLKYVSSSYTVDYVLETVWVDDIYAVLHSTYLPKGSSFSLTKSTTATLSVSGNLSPSCLNGIKGQVGMSGSIAFAYSEGTTMTVPASYKYGTYARPTLRVKYLSKKVAVTQKDKYYNSVTNKYEYKTRFVNGYINNAKQSYVNWQWIY